jgi:TonB-linked SusC/RagA family outer membrane protein
MSTRNVRTALAVALALGSAAAAPAQETGSVTGTVLDRTTREPLASAQVTVPGSRLGVVTNVSGRYLITGVPVGETVVRVQSIGYASSELTVAVTTGSATTADFALQPQAIDLEGLVVVGYGEQRREDITGAVASVTADEFVQAPARDAASLVAGKIAGLAVTTPSGDPTTGTEISLRGIGSLEASGNPLVIVDGVPGELESVAPQDIESIDVLKDGSAAAVYGSRAANGVIFITTKRYDGGAPTIRYDGYVSYQTIYRRPDMLDAEDYPALIEQGLVGIEDMGFTTDWQDQVLRNPVGHTHNLTITGGASNTSYTGSFTYEDVQGIMLRSEQQEVSARLNLSHTMYDGRLVADVNVVNRIETSFDGPDYDYAWQMALKRNPTDRVRDDDGQWQERGFWRYDNPLGLLYEENGEEEDRNLRIHGTLTFRPVSEVSLAILTGTERGSSMSGSATTFGHIATRGTGLNATAARSSASDESQILDLTATWADAFGGHQLTALAGYSYQDILRESFGANNYDFPTDLFGYDDLGSGSALADGQADLFSGRSSFKTIGFFGRLNWDWNNRFLAMASLRYEGDSRFGADHKWGLFPAVSVGWRISEEGFIGDDSAINDLKLRVGFGVTGIAPSDPYLSLTTYEYSGRVLYGGRWVQALQPSGNANPDLRWERKEEINLGLDFSLFDYRLAGSLDVYRRDTSRSPSVST